MFYNINSNDIIPPPKNQNIMSKYISLIIRMQTDDL